MQDRRSNFVDLVSRPHTPRCDEQVLSEQFAGATKASASFLSPLERKLARALLPVIPSWIQTYHLTWLTLFWCVLIVAGSALAARDLRWLWAVSLLIALQWVTDFFDGKLGKYRQTGLAKWGFYMDHFLDYVFLCSLLIGYSLILPLTSRYHIFLVLAVFAGFMVSSFLSFAATSKFDISFYKFGPT
ncbi:MAG: CDP-alcohol phosphatidyltransferase family protein, partial [Pyrinomonadaceae bacterium]